MHPQGLPPTGGDTGWTLRQRPRPGTRTTARSFRTRSKTARRIQGEAAARETTPHRPHSGPNAVMHTAQPKQRIRQVHRFMHRDTAQVRRTPYIPHTAHRTPHTHMQTQVELPSQTTNMTQRPTAILAADQAGRTHRGASTWPAYHGAVFTRKARKPELAVPAQALDGNRCRAVLTAQRQDQGVPTDGHWRHAA
jgi:hypothetical protein